MPKFSEDTFNTWRQPPSDHEESKLNNVQKQVKDAINKDSDLNKLSIDIFGQGSYANDTNVKLNSDIDINIMYKSEFYFDLPENTNNSDFGIVLSDKLSFSDYKNLIEKALVNEFGRSSVLRNNKCIRVASTPTRGECDVVPTFHYKRYSANKSFVEGIKFISDSNNVIVGFPKQHIQNAIDKNKITGKSFKRVTRIFKRLRYRLKEEKVLFPESVTSFLIESLLWNVPNDLFNQSSRWTDIVRESIIFLYNQTKSEDICKEWGEVSELLYLFRGRKWSAKDVNDYMLTLWNYLEFK